MLSTIRDNAQGIVMWIIIGFLVLAMAGFVLPSYFSGGAGVKLASVNGMEIQSRDLNRAVQERKEQLRKQLGEYFNADLINDDMLRAESLQSLVNRELFRQLVDGANLEVSDKQILDQIAGYPQFQDAEGKFSARKYKAVLRQQGMNEAGFEFNVSKDVATNSFNAGLFSSSFVTDKQVKTFNALLAQQRKAGLLRFELTKYKLETTFSDEKISTYYEKNKSRYKTEPAVSVQYLELDLNEIAEQVEIEYKDIADYYDAQVRNGNFSDKDYPMALRIALDMKFRLKKGEDFAALAKKYSRDAASANNGGELGFISKGMMPKPFEDAVYKMKKGEISEPVKTTTGYHVIQLMEIDGDRRKVKHIQIIPPLKVKSLADVKGEITKELQMKQAEEGFFESIDKVQNAIYENADSLEPAAQAAGTNLKTTALFTRATVPTELNNPAIQRAIFNKEVLTQGKNSEAIQLSDTHYVAVRVNEYNPPAQKSLDAVKSQIINDLAQQTRSELIQHDISTAFAALKQGRPAANVAMQFKFARWQQFDFVSRNAGQDPKTKDTAPPAAVLRKLFSMRVPTVTPSVEPITLDKGDEGILVFTASRIDPDFKGNDFSNQRLTARRLNNVYGSAEFVGFEKILRDKSDIVINLQKQTDEP